MNTHYEKSLQLFDRASKVAPGGIYGHMSPAACLPGASPYYAVRGEGCRYWDVDGHEYIDFMCGYGPVILGYNHPEVDEAAAKQRELGNCFNHPTERFVELVERLVSLVDFADWGVLAKNGGDVTTWAIQVAREHTKRKKIIRLKGSYHGVDPWCTPGHGGLIEEDREHIHHFAWNDLTAFQGLVERYRGEIAGLIISPWHHPVFADSDFGAPGFLIGLERICRAEGIVLISDDIRGGFRLNIGGSHEEFGYTPDIVCFCKALGNGYPISAALGTDALRVAASKVFLTGSYWNSAVPMAAALKTLEILERDNVIAKIKQTGQRLSDGLVKIGEKHGHSIKPSGPPSVPFYRLTEEKNFLRQQQWCAEAMQRGAFLHPHHNWFICAAHTDADIDAGLQIADDALAACVKQWD
ncbi:aminotransferase class III-fold pyridoxal phosphate-dependent enzyme [Cerasicoccus arenae]|uniref:Glutamate-1-semialdehyde 2,1-aminomutase n=1 Tax=Cerasicoccus arenae TaxID=424488 RepID=A0A8J3DDS5_9BACT|nr:aminotransferase class III-fold pyridoxal phosphate-dependent enzyme [Cerasicoccus arenae]MBK1857808.1 aminotransferase class III-fold pyridoxal phosphate-dependent enzyme [Cerasicoccus arenae]GHC11751.1 glutamate-1-semialdehyde 2,1-aminomutase [Cerasicoccus arenae]